MICYVNDNVNLRLNIPSVLFELMITFIFALHDRFALCSYKFAYRLASDTT